MTLNCKGKLIDFSTPKVMGILNATPDSFYDGGKNNEVAHALKKVAQMLEEGATFIDIGGYSSRPDAIDISVDEEISRVVPIIEAVVREFPEILISIDTFRARVAKKAILAGASLVNDISAGLLDDTMMDTVSKLGVPYCMMHMRGTPQTMKKQTQYTDITQEITRYFSERLAIARTAGINDVIIDPGFGFSKTVEQNFTLLNKLELLNHLDVPILVGLSRKSMIYKTLKTSPKEALNGTTVLHTIALQKRASIVRVHDVAEAMESITLLSQF